MLSYRHNFHAGNHADIIKHITSSLILESLQKKDKPFVYIDTHSGAGVYDLHHEWAEKTGEYLDGIAKIWDLKSIPEPIHPYLKCIRKLNTNGILNYYPGSPAIARNFIRAQDRMLLSELHPTDFQLLRQEFRRDRQTKVFNNDGFARLKAVLPPKERRGFVLIDPPYELKTEYQDVVNAIKESNKRWATGIYAIWYPVVQREKIDFLINELSQLKFGKILQLELGVAPDNNDFGMTASGMIVINPPWLLDQKMQLILPWLKETLAPQTGFSKIEWIVGE